MRRLRNFCGGSRGIESMQNKNSTEKTMRKPSGEIWNCLQNFANERTKILKINLTKFVRSFRRNDSEYAGNLRVKMLSFNYWEAFGYFSLAVGSVSSFLSSRQFTWFASQMMDSWHLDLNLFNNKLSLVRFAHSFDFQYYQIVRKCGQAFHEVFCVNIT